MHYSNKVDFFEVIEEKKGVGDGGKRGAGLLPSTCLVTWGVAHSKIDKINRGCKDNLQHAS